jgi:hypothetical protein
MPRRRDSVLATRYSGRAVNSEGAALAEIQTLQRRCFFLVLTCPIKTYCSGTILIANAYLATAMTLVNKNI